MKSNEKSTDRIVLLDYSCGDVVILENVPTQEYIDENHDGEWEDWLYTIQDERDDIPRIKDCHWMHTISSRYSSNHGIEYINL
tara:strand:+ start:141 stop:389 length:249 start_codon:yes stop_codon:yes gene_type:complete